MDSFSVYFHFGKHGCIKMSHCLRPVVLFGLVLFFQMGSNSMIRESMQALLLSAVCSPLYSSSIQNFYNGMLDCVPVDVAYGPVPKSVCSALNLLVLCLCNSLWQEMPAICNLWVVQKHFPFSLKCFLLLIALNASYFS